MSGDGTDGWAEFFLAAAGATAAQWPDLRRSERQQKDGPRARRLRDGASLLTGRAIEALVSLLNVLR